MDPATAYFLKKYYPHVIKWWLVVYNPETVRIWPSKAEKDAALRLEAIEAKKEAENKKSQPALEDSGSGLNRAQPSTTPHTMRRPVPTRDYMDKSLSTRTPRLHSMRF